MALLEEVMQHFSLHVMEEGMRHFYVRAMAAKQTKQPDKMIDAAMIQAVQIAACAFERREAGVTRTTRCALRMMPARMNCEPRLCVTSAF